MSKIVLIRVQPPIDEGRVSLYYLGKDGDEDKIDTGPDEDISLKDYVQKRIGEEVQQGNRDFIVDLALVKWVSSSEVGIVLSWYRLAQKLKGRVVLANLHQSVREVMAITRLDTVIEVFDTVAHAREHILKDPT